MLLSISNIDDLYHMGEEFNEILTDWGDQYDDILFGEMRFSKFTRHLQDCVMFV